MNNILFYGLLLHFVGDYLTQNDWLAQTKTTSNLPAFIHASIYSLPFLLLTTNLYAIAIILITHFFIDRFRLAVYWIKLVNWNWSSTNFGYASDKPLWMSVWLMIIVDNIVHVGFNTLALTLFAL